MNRQTISKWISDDRSLPVHQLCLLSSVYLLAFFIPFSWLPASYSIVLSVICLIVSSIRSFPFKIKWNWELVLLPALYGLYALSMFYTVNKQTGWNELGTKFSLLLFPLFFLVSFSFIHFNARKIIWLFVMGCFITGIICLGNSLINFLHDGDIQEFFYKQLSVIIHPGYYAMYLNFAIVFLAWEALTPERQTSPSSILVKTLIIFFSLLVVLLSSKLSIILLFISFIAFFIAIFLQKREDKLKPLISVFTLTIIIAASFFFLKSSLSRFNSLKQVTNYNAVDPTTAESTGLRLEVWKSTVKIVKEHWLFGLGIGDVQDALRKRYQELGITKAVEMNLNAHNQYLHTLLGIGVAGLLLLLFITVGILVKSFLARKYLFAGFLFIMILNFCIEAVLQRQAGVIFFSFFYSLLLLTDFSKAKRKLQDLN